MQHAIRFGNGLVSGVVHYSTVDAVFRRMDGSPVSMEFHRYCGPSFFIGEECWLPEVDSVEWDSIWAQFQGWWDAKGKGIYK